MTVAEVIGLADTKEISLQGSGERLESVLVAQDVADSLVADGMDDPTSAPANLTTTSGAPFMVGVNTALDAGEHEFTTLPE
jgi:hypothetical protein